MRMCYHFSFGRPAIRTGIAMLGLVVMSAWSGMNVSQAQTVISIRGLNEHDFGETSFVILKDTDVRIRAVGAETSQRGRLFSYPWLLNADTRDVVWTMQDEVTEPVKGSDWLRECSDRLHLRKGNYEMYYYAGSPYYFDGEFDSGHDLSEFFEKFGERIQEWTQWAMDGNHKELRRLAREYEVTLECPADAIREGGGRTIRVPAIDLSEPDNDSYERVRFAVSTDISVEIYAIGEYWGSSGELVDKGWIADAASGRIVWEMTDDNTDRAGGAEKNRRFRGQVRLPQGEYVAYYITDDSHTADDWNSPPPHDPHGWGLRIFPVSQSDRASITRVADRPDATALVRLTGVGDNELLSEAFRLEKESRLRVYALGEYDRFSDCMADYAWLKSGDDGQKIWVMSGSNTLPAGGADKNRMFDGVVDLSPGEYVLYYVTDGSHSYADGWNSSPPFDQRAYGVSVYAGETDFDPVVFQRVDQRDVRERNAIVSIVSSQDDSELSRRFTLTTPTRVRIHAVGEGDRNGMYDYGWIEDLDADDVVWEMTYRKTSHAGGADKNRLVDQVILLDKGEYAVYYVTDGSHHLGDWNSDPPEDPTMWGIIITRAGDGE